MPVDNNQNPPDIARSEETPDARRRAERFLTELAERARMLTDPDAVIADAVRSVGEFLGVARCVFVDIDIAADLCVCHADYCADNSVASMAGVFPISAFGAVVVAAYGAGRAVAVNDVRADPAQVPPESVAAYDATGIRAHASAPVVHSGRLVSCIGAHSATPRRWKPEEVELLQTVVERTWLIVEVLRQQRALTREAQATLRILESITDAFFTLDHEWRFTYINRQAEAVWGRAREDLLGRNVWDEFPEAVGSPFDQQFRRALSEGSALTFEEFYPPLQAWLDVRVYPSSEGLSVFFQNVNERKAVEAAREAVEKALHASEERFRLMADAIPHIAWTTGADGAVEYYNQRWYEYSGLTLEQTQGWGWEAVIHPDDLAHAGGVWHGAVAAGVVSEVEYRLRRADGQYRLHLGRSVPMRENGRIARWVGTATDIEDRRVAEEALRASEERMRLALEGSGLGTWHWNLVTGVENWPAKSKALFGLPPDAPINRKYILSIVHSEDRARVEAAIKAALEGGPAYNEEYRIHWPDDSLHWISSRGQVYQDSRGVAIRMEGIVQDITAWRQLTERDHQIADQLQKALQPPLPERVAGLSLAKYYEAALDEAGVGGDFYDVFAVENNCTVLAVGDVAGKGLAAAAQVATVRNMVRYAVFRGRTLAGAITNLNAVLVEQGLLTGFATLFIACYDSVAHTLSYVNCGQEPGLLRRGTTGEIEPLLPTGPVLGAFEGASYEEQTVALSPGDALVIFTDGVTECGVSRREMLGIEGATALLKSPFASEGNDSAERMAEELALRLVTGVDAASRGGLAKDDICILVAVADLQPNS